MSPSKHNSEPVVNKGEPIWYNGSSHKTIEAHVNNRQTENMIFEIILMVFCRCTSYPKFCYFFVYICHLLLTWASIVKPRLPIVWNGLTIMLQWAHLLCNVGSPNSYIADSGLLHLIWKCRQKKSPSPLNSINQSIKFS